MAITRVGVMANPPTNIDDYTHILAHLDAYAKQVGNQGMLLTQWGNASGVPAIAKGSYISHGGTLFVVDTEDFLVAAPASNGTYYLRVAGSGASLAVSWVTSIGGYTWNAIYNGLYDGSENQILPYMLIKTGAVLEKWKISNLMQGGNFNRVDYLGRVIMGALTCASVDTGQGANELYGMDQDVKKTSAVEFASVNTGFGANEVYKLSEQTIAFGTVTGTDKIMSMSAMDIKEIRMVNTTGIITKQTSASYYISLKLPAGGTYFVVGQSDPYAERVLVFGGVFSGGTIVAQAQNQYNNDTPFNVALIIRRIS